MSNEMKFIALIDNLTKNVLSNKLDEKAIVEYIKTLAQISIICSMALNASEEDT